MYGLLDMGTTHTRLFLQQGAETVYAGQFEFGAGTGKRLGRDALLTELHRAITTALDTAGVTETQVDCLMAAGMIGSEAGLCEVPHRPLPADAGTLADALFVQTVPAVTSIPFVLVPGLKKTAGGALADLIRGEETEIFGLLNTAAAPAEAVYLLPGSHNKAVRVTDGTITDFVTMMSGELLSAVMTDTILAGSVSFEAPLSEAYVLRGAACAREQGLSAALFQVRVGSKNGWDTAACTSFLCGAVLAGDIPLIRQFAGASPLILGGQSTLCRAYSLLLPQAQVLPAETAANAVRQGLAYLHTLWDNRQKRPQTLDAFRREKLVAILRRPEEQTVCRAMAALYEGGVRLAEVTFDRSGVGTREDTARIIALLAQEFEGKMLIGAGTVMDEQDVLTAAKAGARFIISPNADPAVIRLTRQLGLVSLPAAMTPTEIALAMQNGADFVKLFPAGTMGAGYLKAVTAPLADAPLIAVGGVTADNAAAYIEEGFVGVGVGGGLYDTALIKAGDFDGLTARARAFTEAIGAVK